MLPEISVMLMLWTAAVVGDINWAKLFALSVKGKQSDGIGQKKKTFFSQSVSNYGMQK